MRLEAISIQFFLITFQVIMDKLSLLFTGVKEVGCQGRTLKE